MRSPSLLLGLLAVSALLGTGCAARRARLEGVATAPESRRIPVAPRALPGASGGYLRLRDPSVALHLRDDTPSLSEMLEARRLADVPQVVESDPSYGPVGASGEEAWGFDAVPGGSVPTYASPLYFSPGGAVVPGLRVPHDTPTPSPASQPFSGSFPSGDAAVHRPGLSTGSGAFSRDVTTPPPPEPKKDEAGQSPGHTGGGSSDGGGHVRGR